jgi:hypothetical protein
VLGVKPMHNGLERLLGKGEPCVTATFAALFKTKSAVEHGGNESAVRAIANLALNHMLQAVARVAGVECSRLGKVFHPAFGKRAALNLIQKSHALGVESGGVTIAYSKTKDAELRHFIHYGLDVVSGHSFAS